MRFLSHHRRLSRPELTGFLLTAVVMGSVVVFTHAAGAFLSIEPENGTLSGAATVVSDASASAGKAVQFGAVSSNPLAVKVLANHLVDGSGATMQLRGVDRMGSEYACVHGWGFFDGPTDSTSISAIRSWGANAVRVPLNEDCWLGINGSPTAYSGVNYQNAIKTYVASLNEQNLRVILDLHWSAPGTTLSTGQEPMADRDHAPAFWTSVAGAFKSNPSVLFDLYNEPYPDNNSNTTAAWTCIRDGGTCNGVSFTAAGAQELVNAIRGTGATNVILIGGTQYAGRLDQWLTYKPSDSAGQLAASIHIYFNTVSSPGWSACYLQSCWDTYIAPVANSSPVVIGEFGEFDCANSLINGTGLNPPQQNVMSWADSHGISYLAWAWTVASCTGTPSVINDYGGTPSGYGQIVHDHLLSLPH